MTLVSKMLAITLGLGLAGLAPIAHAQYPQKPLRMIVAGSAGGGPDVIARVLTDKLDPLLGKRVVVENRPGANGLIAMNALRQAPADGYTLGLVQAAIVTTTPLTYKEATYDIDRDYGTVGMVASTPFLFVANAHAPGKSLAEVIALARAKPDDVVIGNPQRASFPHLAAELLAQRSGVRFRQIPFSSGQGVRAVVSGDIPYYVDGPNVFPLVKSGTLRVLAVTADRVLPGLEGIPLAKDTVRELTVYGWFMVAVPKGTPAAAIQRLNLEINKAIGMSDVIGRFRDLGAYAMPGSIEDAQRFVRSEKELWAKVIREAGIAAE